jgi:uncharacterized protein
MVEDRGTIRIEFSRFGNSLGRKLRQIACQMIAPGDIARQATIDLTCSMHQRVHFRGADGASQRGQFVRTSSCESGTPGLYRWGNEVGRIPFQGSARSTQGAQRTRRHEEASEIAEPGLTHDAAVENWRDNAHRHDEKNYTFLRSLKFQNYDLDPDRRAVELHQQAFQIVDCTRCANCCKTLKIGFNDEDIERIAKYLNMTVDAFITEYLDYDDEPGLDGKNRHHARGKPCPFLDENNRCKIYDVRPILCREYPHTDKDGFTRRTIGVAENALICPDVFWIVEQLKHEARQ